MTPSLQLLNAVRVNTIMQQLQDVRLLPQQLSFLARTPIIPALDSDILASYQGYVYIADLIADDAQAVAYSTGKFVFESTAIPNLKIGTAMSQTMLMQLQSAIAGLSSADDRMMFRDWEARTVDSLLLGIRQRMEALIIAMHVGSLSYDRLGIKMTSVTWGRPSDLSATAAVSWATAATATPVADILGMKRLAQTRYGITYNRVTMSTQAFLYMIATTEFQNKASLYLPAQVSFTNLATDNLMDMQALAERTIGMSIELYDARYWYQTSAGSVLSAPFLPITSVILSSTADDNDPTAFDWANGIVTESIVGSLASTSMVGQLAGPTRGPIAYTTVPADMNPPSVTYWGVARGFPRYHRKQSSAHITAGSFSDTIAATEPSIA